MSEQRGNQLKEPLKVQEFEDEQIVEDHEDPTYINYDSYDISASGISANGAQNYKAAREQLLEDIVPHEDYNAKTSCLFRTCCCFYYMFCCCICCEKSKSVTKQTFVKRFEKWLNIESRLGRRDKTLKVAKTMMRMYAHQPGAIKDLEKCRVNPDFNSIFRDDLEFFIPQLCSFYLKGNLENPHSLLKLIIMASQTNFFFSHRVWFFFHSAMFQEFQQQIYEMSMGILKGLKQICLDQNQDEKLYIANSQKVSEMIVQLFMSDFYSPQIQKIQLDTKLSEEQIYKNKQKQAEKVGIVNRIITNYINKIPNEAEELQGVVIAAQDIVLRPFIYSLDQNEHLDAQALNSDEKRQKLNSFLSTPKFIKCLTEISQNLGQMKDTPKSEKVSILQQELMKLNQHLPASVYIPFVQNSTRNYCVLHIPPAEARVFQTKERAPIMLSIEVFRPDEMLLTINQQKNRNTLRRRLTQRTQQPDNPYFQAEQEDVDSEEDDEPRRSKFKDLLKKQHIKKQNKKLLTIDQKIQKKADQNVSKPIVIRRLKAQGDRKINDDFGLNYLPNAGGSEVQTHLINESDMEIGQADVRNQTFQHNTSALDTAPAIQKEDDFGMGMTQFLNFNKDQFDMNRSRSDGNFLQDLHAPLQTNHSVNSDGKKKIPKNLINKNMTPKSNDIKLEQQIIQEHQDEETFSKSSRTDSELDSIGEVSSDGGEYQDLPIIIETAMQGENNGFEDEQGQNLQVQQHFQTYQDRQIVGDVKPKAKTSKVINKKSFVIETSKAQRIRVQENSPFGALKSWNLIRVIVKSIDDVRQEQFAMQLISQIYQIFKIKKLPLWLKTYEILATGPNCGLIEVINDAMSIDEIHKRADGASLLDYFVVQHGRGKIKSKRFKKAQKNFCYSLAAYSLVQYILQIKDRHNQNIMIDAEGHIVHIDYGFLLSNAPGKGLKFEQAPFKLTTECVKVLGGVSGKYYKLFRDLVKLGFMALQEHADKIIILVEMMMLGQKDLPCFQDGEQTVSKLKERFFPTKKMMTEAEAKRYTEDLILQSENNWRTNLYDKVQYCCQGIV